MLVALCCALPLLLLLMRFLRAVAHLCWPQRRTEGVRGKPTKA
jgi:hypothetical protein